MTEGDCFLRGSGAPYGEARRLRYFVQICSELLQFPSVDMDFLIDRLIESVEKINPKLDEYVRKTGIMQSRAVTRNYLRFAGWLNFLRIEGRLIVPNSYTVFFANLNGREDFFLTKREKVAFFLHLIELEELLRLLVSLKMKNAIKDYIRDDLSEHFVESFFEWFVDLGILRPTSRRFGLFNLSNLGYHVHESCKDKLQPLRVSGMYVTNLLSTPVEYNLNIPDDDVWASFEESLQKLAKYTRSEVDFNLYSALPLVLDLQVRLIFDHHSLVPTAKLIQTLKNISASYNMIFSWDPLAKAGYVKIQKVKK